MTETKLSPPTLRCRHGNLSLLRPAVAGILNITPDSFHDGGLYQSETAVLKRVGQMLEEGAALIDIGAVSSRPGADQLSVEEELKRLIPIIKVVRKTFPKVLISADTFVASVAQVALDAGADMINDIYGGSLNNGLAELAGKEKVPYILMHMQGNPETMQKAPFYKNVRTEVETFFKERIKLLTQKGVEQIILDPGFGFGKTVTHNYELLNGLDTFTALGYPVMAGLSRKSMINKVLGISQKEALNGTTAVNMIALLKGALLLRVHDIKEAVQTIRIFEQLKDPSKPV
jgi:dihydropteroate synthase